MSLAPDRSMGRDIEKNEHLSLPRPAPKIRTCRATRPSSTGIVRLSIREPARRGHEIDTRKTPASRVALSRRRDGSLAADSLLED
jgi:hypothetical protein